MSVAVSFEGVSKAYEHFALEQVSFELETGTVLGFVGPNGAGKSTSLRILMGLVHQDAGRVRVLGQDLPAQHALAKRDIGFVSDDLRLYGQASLEWHMGLMASIYPGWDTDYAASLLQRFDLRAQQHIKGLSHGERVKASLLLALAWRPRLLVLDEPTTGLDPITREDVLGELMEVLADGERTILFSSHNTAEIEQISDRILFLDRGRVIACQDKESYLESWARLRLELPEGLNCEELPGLVSLRRQGAAAVAIVNAQPERLAQQLRERGARVQAVERLSLQEIFVHQVKSSRGEQA